jgi:molecular chaperone GrpE
LNDFRAWLTDLSAAPGPADAPATVDLHTLVAQFAALRHEVNLQTKATRSSLEQTSEALARLDEAVEALEERPPDDDELKPLLRTAVDVYDNLGIALRQAIRQREALEKPLAELAVAPRSRQVAGFWARLFNRAPVGAGRDDVSNRVPDAARLVRSSLDALIAGYTMSLARVDRALAQFELEPIPVEGQAFDPELMEAAEVVGDTGRPAGDVVEELRRGYIWRGVVFRFAQVKVAR